jgi:pSer/pThr/pTyr-binding forkhead associated (FHA) protein
MRLFIEDDAGGVQVVPVGGDEITLGRAQDNTLVLEERNVSRHHAKVRLSDGCIYLSDAGSRYGIKLDGGRLLNEVEIRAGDMFLLGDFRVKLLAPDGALVEGEDAGGDSAVSREVTSVAAGAWSGNASSASMDSDVGMMTLQEMEEVARLGWRSDFYDEEEEPAARKRALVHVLLVILLATVAAGLGFAYYTIYVDDLIVQPRTHQTVPVKGGSRE